MSGSPCCAGGNGGGGGGGAGGGTARVLENRRGNQSGLVPNPVIIAAPNPNVNRIAQMIWPTLDTIGNLIRLNITDPSTAAHISDRNGLPMPCPIICPSASFTPTAPTSASKPVLSPSRHRRTNSASDVPN